MIIIFIENTNQKINKPKSNKGYKTNFCLSYLICNSNMKKMMPHQTTFTLYPLFLAII